MTGLTYFLHSTAVWSSPGEVDANLIELLERADNERTFERFVDLPAELREMVSGYACTNEGLVRPRVPGIFQTSRQLRNESKAVFRKHGFRLEAAKLEEAKEVRCCHWAKRVGGCTRHPAE